jgi:ABC-2 type transport system permease protein
MKKTIYTLLLSLLGIIAINFISNKLFFRVDLTAEKRYTLTPATKKLLANLKQKIEIEVYLEGKDLPAGMKRLRNETRELLQEFRTYSNGNITYKFLDVNAIKKAEQKEKKIEELIQKGVKPINLEVNTNSGYIEKLIFPGAVLKSGDREIPIQILENQFAFGAQGAINNSINFLEYKVANSIQKLIRKMPPRVAFLQGHDELPVAKLQDIINTLALQNFEAGKIDLATDQILNNNIDILIVAKPRRTFLEEEKFLIDQFIMHGGKVIWLLDNHTADLQNFQQSPTYLATPLELNIEDLLFRYGVRVNYDLALDLYCSQIPIIETVGGNPQPKLFPWVFYPIAVSKNNHPIVQNIDPIWFRFASSIDVLNNPNLHPTVLAATSTYSRTQPLPFEIYLLGAKQKPNPNLFNRKNIVLAALMEGEFTSFYLNQYTSDFQLLMQKQGADFKGKSLKNKMIVIADGDVIANDLDSKGTPLALGYDKYSQQQFANKDFILNCVEYMVDDNNLIEARNREVRMRLLDKARLAEKKELWQFLNFAVPVSIIAVFGFFYQKRRQKKYAS